MTAFIVKSVGNQATSYIVRDSQCLGRSCLSLGNRVVMSHPLSFGEPVETNCCTMMIDKGCPKNYEKLFSVKQRFENSQSGMSIRLI